MAIYICGAPCCWGVDDISNPFLPTWQRVLHEAHQAGYRAIELGPNGWIPTGRVDEVKDELEKNGLSIVAGTIFDDCLSDANFDKLMRQTDAICRLITQLPPLPMEQGQHYKTPYMTIMDWGHDERDYAAGHSDRAPRLEGADWDRLVAHFRAICEKAASYGVRPVLHPHAGGYVEFEDEIDRLMQEIPPEIAGLVLDTGHMTYSGMDPCAMLRKYRDRLDYVHFKDIDAAVYQQVMGEHIRFFEGCAKGSMCPIGKGMLDYRAIRETLLEIDYQGYITIEQERDPRNSDTSLRDVSESVRFLKSIGFQTE